MKTIKEHNVTQTCEICNIPLKDGEKYIWDDEGKYRIFCKEHKNFGRFKAN